MKILISDNLEENVIEKLRELGEVEYKPEDLQKAVEYAEILIVRSATQVNSELISKAKKLKIVARAGVGLDNIDVSECERRGIKVINTPDAPTIAVAELTIGLIIAMFRKIIEADNSTRAKIWKKKELVGNELYGKTFGIIGLGRIGKAVAKRASVFGMNILTFDLFVKNSDVAKMVSLDELLKKSDIVSLHVPATNETNKMINRENISKMKDGVYLLNLSRGPVIDEDALFDALKNGKIKCAALDVFSKEPYKGKLLELQNVIFTPHIGANTKEAQERIGEELIEKLKEMLKSI